MLYRCFVVPFWLSRLILLWHQPNYANAINGGQSRVNVKSCWRAIEIISEHDSRGVSGWKMPGSFDGGGAYLYDKGRKIRIHVNHELSQSSISEVNLDKAKLLEVISKTIASQSISGIEFVTDARIAYDQWSPNGGVNWRGNVEPASTRFCRFCSSQEFAPHTFGNNRGFVDQLYITGEECPNGRLFALDSSTREMYQLSDVVGGSGAGNGGIPRDPWENVALIDTGETKHVALLLSSDGDNQPKSLKLYVGKKGKNRNGASSDDFLSRNGLANGQWFYLGAVFPNTGQRNAGAFRRDEIGALTGGKLEDVDTCPSQPNKVVLTEQNQGIYVLDFDLVFQNSAFDDGSSRFGITKINSDGIRAGDNVDWTARTADEPQGRIFVNEDSGRMAIWSMRPNGSDKVQIGTINAGGEPTGIFDLSDLVDYPPGTVLVNMNQGNPASMTLLINPVLLDECLAPPPAPVEVPGLPGGATLYQAETATRVGTDTVRRHGATYEDFSGQGAFIEWTVEAPTDGSYDILVRYSSGANNRYCDFLLDGERVSRFDFRGSNWTIWQVEDHTVEMSAGMHTLKIIASQTPGPNIDLLAVFFPTSPPVPTPTTSPEAEPISQPIALPIAPPSSPPTVAPTLPPGYSIYEAETATTFKTDTVQRNGMVYEDFSSQGAFIEWTVDVPIAGIYDILVRYASVSNNRYCDLLLDGDKVDRLAFRGSDWNDWQVETLGLEISAGNHSLKIVASNTAGANIDFLATFFVASLPPMTQPPTSPPTAAPTLPPGYAIYEAEAATSFMTDTVRRNGVVYEDFAGQGSFIEWTIDIPVAGTYDILVRYASVSNNRYCEFLLDGERVNRFDFQGFDWNIWQIEELRIDMSVGTHTLKIVASHTGGPNIDRLETRLVVDTNGPTPRPSPQPTSLTLPSPVSTPIAPLPISLPTASPTTRPTVVVPTLPVGYAIYEAESATTFKTDTVRRNGVVYEDFSGQGAFIEWTIDTPITGTYDILVRYASVSNNRYCEFLLDGERLDRFDFQGFDWNVWQIEELRIDMSAGTHTLKIVASHTGGPNIDRLETRLVAGSKGPTSRPSPLPTSLTLPTSTPTVSPSLVPTLSPTLAKLPNSPSTMMPTQLPTSIPTLRPSVEQTSSPVSTLSPTDRGDFKPSQKTPESTQVPTTGNGSNDELSSTTLIAILAGVAILVSIGCLGAWRLIDQKRGRLANDVAN